jgi:hypothetical protein
MLLGVSTYNRWTDTLTNLAEVPAQVEAARVAKGLTTIDQAAQIGIGVDTLTKLGPTSARATVEKCLAWLAKA